MCIIVAAESGLNRVHLKYKSNSLVSSVLSQGLEKKTSRFVFWISVNLIGSFLIKLKWNWPNISFPADFSGTLAYSHNEDQVMATVLPLHIWLPPEENLCGSQGQSNAD